MNLVKNGAVLLAALSVLAMTSCNKGDTKKKVDYDGALAWVKEHYKSTEEGTEPSSAKLAWDYSKNKTKESFPEDKRLDILSGADGNDITQIALESLFEAKGEEQDFSKTKGDTTITRGFSKNFFKLPLNEEEFVEEYGDPKEGEELTFSIVNDKALVVTITSEEEFKKDPIVIKYTQTEKREYSDKGYGKIARSEMTNSNVVVKNPIDQTDINLGSIDIITSITLE